MGQKLRSLISVERKISTPKKDYTSEKLLSKYVNILSDGEIHWIPDLLTVFELPNTSNGREKLRCMNLKLNMTGKVYVKVERKGKNKGFQLKHVQED